MIIDRWSDLHWNVLLWRGSLFQICICLWVELKLQSRNIQSWNELRSDGNHFHNESRLIIATSNVKMRIIIAKKSFSQWIAIAKELKGDWSVSCSMGSDRGVNNPILSNFTTNSVFLFLNNKKYLKSPNNKRFLFLGLLTFAPAAALRECWFIGLLAKRPPHFCRNTFRNTQLQKYTKTNTQIDTDTVGECWLLV